MIYIITYNGVRVKTVSLIIYILHKIKNIARAIGGELGNRE